MQPLPPPSAFASLLGASPIEFRFDCDQTRAEIAAALAAVPADAQAAAKLALLRHTTPGYDDDDDPRPLAYYMPGRDEEIGEDETDWRMHNYWKLTLYADGDLRFCDFYGLPGDNEGGAGVLWRHSRPGEMTVVYANSDTNLYANCYHDIVAAFERRRCRGGADGSESDGPEAGDLDASARPHQAMPSDATPSGDAVPDAVAAGWRPEHYYVVSDCHGFVGAFVHPDEVRDKVVNAFSLTPFVVERFRVAPGPFETVWVVLYRDLDAVAFVSNDRAEAERVRAAYAAVGLAYPDPVDYWEHPAGAVAKGARERLEATHRAHQLYADPAVAEEARRRDEASLARLEKMLEPNPDGPIARLLREEERITILDCVRECPVAGADFDTSLAPVAEPPTEPAAEPPAEPAAETAAEPSIESDTDFVAVSVPCGEDTA